MSDMVSHPRWRRVLIEQMRALPIAYYATAVLLLFALVARPNMLTPFLLLLVMRQAAPLGIAVIGQSLCIRLLSLDLSFGGVAIATSYILTSGSLHLPPVALIIVSLLFGAGVGAANAFFITRLRASSVIVTLAMVLILSGIVTALSQYHAPGNSPDILCYIGQTRFGPLPVSVIVWIAVLIPTALFLRFSVFGRYTDVIGANPRAAMASGVPYIRAIYIAHISSSVFAVVSTFLLVGFVGFGSLSLGTDLALNSLAAVILGGVGFGSGKGGVIGPAVAAFMLMFAFNLLTSIGLGEPVKQMVQGAIVALAAIAYAARARQKSH